MQTLDIIKVDKILNKFSKEIILLLADKYKIKKNKKQNMIDQLKSVLSKEPYFIKYILTSEKYSRAGISKKVFIQEVEKLNEEIGKFNLVDKKDWHSRIIPCFILGIEIDKLNDILNKCIINVKRNTNKYLISGDNIKIEEFKLNEFIKKYNKEHNYKILAQVKDENENEIRITFYNDVGLRRISYFINDLSDVKTQTFRIAYQHYLYIFRDDDNYYFTTNLNINKIEYSNLIQSFLMLVFGKKVTYEKDLTQEIKKFEKEIKKNKDLAKIGISISTVRSDLINKIKKDNTIEKKEKQELLNLANTITFTGIYAHNLDKIGIKKYLLEGDIEGLKTNKPDLFKQIDTIIKESKDYELMIDINSKTFGISNGEYKKPLGRLKSAEFKLFEMMVST